MRLDKYLTSCYIGSRKEVRGWIKEKKIKVNGIVVKDAEYAVDEINDQHDNFSSPPPPICFKSFQIKNHLQFFFLYEKEE